MSDDPNWLWDSLKSAAAEVATWPDWKKRAFRVIGAPPAAARWDATTLRVDVRRLTFEIDALREERDMLRGLFDAARVAERDTQRVNEALRDRVERLELARTTRPARGPRTGWDVLERLVRDAIVEGTLTDEEADMAHDFMGERR